MPIFDPASGMYLEEPVIGPVTPWSPPVAPPSGGGSQFPSGLTDGGFNTGYPGTMPSAGTSGSQIPPQQFDWDALYKLDQTLAEYFQNALNALGIDVVGSPFGQQLMKMFLEGKGFDEATLGAMKTRAAETQAGATANASDAVAASANRTGFGNSAAANYAQGLVRQQGAQQLQRGLLDIDVANQQMGLNRQGMAASGLQGLYGLQTGLAGQQANLWANRQAQMYPSDFTPGQQGQQNQQTGFGGFNNSNWYL